MQIRNGIECNFISIKQHQKSFDRHLKRLEKIQKIDPKKKVKKSPTPLRSSPFNRITKEKEIHKKNCSLVRKLIMINNRPSQAFPKTKSLSTLKSLNKLIREKEAKRIHYENEFLVQRIITQKPLITKKDLDSEFEVYKKYCDRLSKRKFLKYNENILTMISDSCTKKKWSKSPSCDNIFQGSSKRNSRTPKPSDSHKKSENELKSRSFDNTDEKYYPNY